MGAIPRLGSTAVSRTNTLAAADMTAFGAAAKMEPPAAGRQAFHAAGAARLGQEIDALSL